MSHSLMQDAGWILGEACERRVSAIAAELDLSPITARVLVRRGAGCPDEAAGFLNPSLDALPDPISIPDLRKASERIAAAVVRREPISVFGDYDVDGITGAALLAQFLEEIGAKASVELPHRRQEGYGITPGAVERMARAGVRLAITVDNGTAAAAAASRARELGLDLIVTDHHAVKEELPEALAIVNPKRMDEGSDLCNLAGCGVAFMLCVDIRRVLRESGDLRAPEPNLGRALDLVALGTIADAVALTGVNRILAHAGLREISLARRPGIRALMEVSGTEPASVGTQAVGFRLGPRLNAAGRIGDPAEALGLLMSNDLDEARGIARRLDRANARRQSIQEICLREALAKAETQPAFARSGAIVVDSEGWHVGVVGIVAAKLAERFSRPAVVITHDADPPRGSCRSARGVDLVKALGECDGLLIRHGGHRDAAGLSIEVGRIAEFTDAFASACETQISSVPQPPLEVDALVDAASIDQTLTSELAGLAPFGEGNPEPLLALCGATVVSQRLVGTGHLKLSVEADGLGFDAIGFGMSSLLPEGTRRVGLAFTPEQNTYNGVTSVQLRLRDIAALP